MLEDGGTTYLDSFQMSNFDLVQGDHHEGGLGELDQCIGRRLNKNIGAVGNTGEADLSEGDVDIYTLILASISDFLSECLELAIKRGSPASFLLLSLKFFLVTISMLASAVASLVELHFRGLAIELDIPCLSLPDHDRCLQVHVDEDNQLVGAWLEEEMLDVAKEHINMLVAER